MSSARPLPVCQHIMQPHKRQQSDDQLIVARESAPAPFASIVIPVYNHEKYLGAALDSVIAQTDLSWEAIVVNDGSTDGTADIANDYAARDSRIHVIHKTNGGVASALNAGLTVARGDWIHWLSSDDMFDPKKLELNRRWIAANPKTKFFFSYFALLRQDTGIAVKHDLWGPVPETKFQIMTLLYRNYISGITICIERETLKQVGFFDERFHYSQDYHLWLRVLKKVRAVFIPEWMVINRNHSEQGSEVFPLACVYDTAKAAIYFVNDNAFSALVPWSDLNDFEQAHSAVLMTLETALDRTSFIYGLGAHPGLMLRLLEWLYGENIRPELAAVLRPIVLQRIRQEALQEGDDPWCVMWRSLAAACAGTQLKFNFTPIDPVAQAVHLHASDRQAPHAQALRTYLERFENRRESESAPHGSGNSTVILILPTDGDAALCNISRQVASHLSVLGNTVILLRPADFSLEWKDNYAELGLHHAIEDQLPWLGEVDFAVWIDRPSSIWIEAEHDLILRDEDCSTPDRLTSHIVDALNEAPSENRQPVVFFEISLWGGGAERVVLNLAKRLGRRRYCVYVITLHDTLHPVEMPPGVQHLRIQDWLNIAPVLNTGGPVMSANSTEPHPIVKVVSDTIVAALATTGNERIQAAMLIAAAKIDSICNLWSEEHLPPAAQQSLARRVARVIYRMARPGYYFLSNSNIRRRLSVGTFLRRVVNLVLAGRAASSPTLPEMPLTTVEVAAPSGFATEPSEILIGKITETTMYAAALQKALEGIPGRPIVISVMEQPAIIAWANAVHRNTKFVASIHTVESAYFPIMHPDPLTRELEARLLSAACNDAEIVTVPTLGCGADLIEHFNVEHSKIEVHPNPVNCAHVRRLSWAEPERVLTTYGKFVFIHVGRLSEEKNHDLLIDACAHLANRRDDFHVHCVGSGHEKERLVKKVQGLKLEQYFTFTEHTHNPFPYMRRAHALVLTSIMESFAMVLVEAMICGIPIVSVDCPTGPQDVLDGGRHGILVSPGDPAALSNAMASLMDDTKLCRRYVAAGLERAANFDVSAITRDWERLIDATSTVVSDQSWPTSPMGMPSHLSTSAGKKVH